MQSTSASSPSGVSSVRVVFSRYRASAAICFILERWLILNSSSDNCEWQRGHLPVKSVRFRIYLSTFPSVWTDRRHPFKKGWSIKTVQTAANYSLCVNSYAHSKSFDDWNQYPFGLSVPSGWFCRWIHPMCWTQGPYLLYWCLANVKSDHRGIH